MVRILFTTSSLLCVFFMLCTVSLLYTWLLIPASWYWCNMATFHFRGIIQIWFIIYLQVVQMRDFRFSKDDTFLMNTIVSLVILFPGRHWYLPDYLYFTLPLVAHSFCRSLHESHPCSAIISLSCPRSKLSLSSCC